MRSAVGSATAIALVLGLLALAAAGAEGCRRRDQRINGYAAPASSRFDPGRLRVGDRLLGLVVEDLRLQTAFDSTLVGSVTFGGEIALRGTRIRHFDSEVDAVCVELDSLSDRRLPRWMGDTRRRWFCFSNDAFARAALRRVPVGATMGFVIRRLQVVRFYSDAVDAAELVRLIDWDGMKTTSDESSAPQLPRPVVPSKASTPRFEDLPVPPEDFFRGRPASVDLTTHREARMYRTRLRRAAATGPNFAGHYTVVSIGCGTECQRIGIVDARSGRVWVAPWITNVGSRYRLESTLFVANPEEEARLPVEMGAAPERYVTRYYEWTGRGLALLDTVMYVPQ